MIPAKTMALTSSGKSWARGGGESDDGSWISALGKSSMENSTGGDANGAGESSGIAEAFRFS
jgi:hypothetical protein